MNDKIGVTSTAKDGQAAIPAYQSDNGVPTFAVDDPYLISDEQKLLEPIPLMDAGGPVWYDENGSPCNALPVTELPSTNPTPEPVPGPLDYIENGADLDYITVEYDLAREVAMLGVAFRHSGTVTSMTATHGGEALELVNFVLNDVDNIGAAVFIGNGLTIEPAMLVITPVGGGKVGPAVVRIDDSFNIDEVQVGMSESQFGFSYIGAASQPMPITVTPVGGQGWGVYALAVSGAEAPSFARGFDGASPLEVLFGAPASSGVLKPVPPFEPNATWAQGDEGWWQHSGTAYSYLIGESLGAEVPNPFWWEIEIDVPEGCRIYVQAVGAGGVLSETFLGPISGVFRRYRHQTYSAKSFRIQANGDAKFRNFQYCDNGQTVFGAFGRTVNTIPNNARVQFQIGKLSRYAGVVAEVHEAGADTTSVTWDDGATWDENQHWS